MVGLFQETGPCEVIEIAQGKLGTQARDWGWDRSSNILYIDQPNQVGFSYDTPTNGSLNLFTSEISFPPSKAASSQLNYTSLNGTFSSNNKNLTANTTEIAAHATWHILQGFFSTFPQYNPSMKSKSAQRDVIGVNLFAESYGGKYGPAFAAFWEQQNRLRRNGVIPKNKTFEVRLVSLGILQGCIDDLIQGRFYPIFANNNTYGVQALSLVDQQAVANSFISSGGCEQLIQSCRSAVASFDPESNGDRAAVNSVCKTASVSCANNLIGPFHKSGRDIYDIARKSPDPFPPRTYLEYLNSADVQAAIGAVVNYTETSSAVADAFVQTGDYERGNQIREMVNLLSLGVRVALIYGDRDYVCNWLGGEAVSFSIAANSPSHKSFYAAGYADIIVNNSYVGGVVRQSGNLSFSRIYDAGHLIPAYQPETAFIVFTRIIMGSDISLGEPVDLSTYSSNGTMNATYINSAPGPLKPTCYVRDIARTCSEEQKEQLRKGQGDIINGVFYSDLKEWDPPASSVTAKAGFPGNDPYVQISSSTAFAGSVSASSSNAVPTGVFIATGTPTAVRKSVASICEISTFSLLLTFAAMMRQCDILWTWKI